MIVEPSSDSVSADSRSSTPPLPPVDLRRLVCHDDHLFEVDPNQYAVDGLRPEDFEAVFDFGCGCGRVARQMMVQPTPPKRYVGVDIHRGMIKWCQRSLAPYREGFEFFHHDVYNKNLGPNNARRRTAPFPVRDAEFSLLIAHSVFTHVALDQTIFYLHEMRRILRPGGLAKTTWFLFSKRTFPMMDESQLCLFINEDDPTNAVVYDWEYVRQAVRDAGFRIRRIRAPQTPGHQWELLLEVRTDDRADALPTLTELQRGLCAAPVDEESLQALPARDKAPQPEPVRLRYTGKLDKEEFDQRCGELDWWYHSYYFDNGFGVRGDYDIGADVAAYGFPQSMKGWNVLDVGAGAGWFSFYFEQLGAKVTAVDARGYEDFDVYGRPGYEQVEREPDRYDDDGRPVYHSPVNQAFWIMRELLDSQVRFVNARAYDVHPDLFDGEEFDLVFLGALLCHLRDPVGALMAARRVCRGMVMASTPVVIEESPEDQPPLQYLPYTSNDKISWWLPNQACFRHWFEAAGFRAAEVGPEVTLRCDLERISEDGRVYNGSQRIRVGRAWVRAPALEEGSLAPR